MAQQVKPDDASLISWTHIVTGENHTHRMTTVPQGLEGCSLLGITASCS